MKIQEAINFFSIEIKQLIEEERQKKNDLNNYSGAFIPSISKASVILKRTSIRDP